METFRCETLSDLKLVYLVVKDLFPTLFVQINLNPFKLVVNHNEEFKEIDVSIFDNIPKGDFAIKKKKETWELARIAGEMITKDCFEQPNDLEFEKCYIGGLLQFKKKHYVGKMYEYNSKKPHEIPEKFQVDKKGIVLKRRDNIYLIRKMYQSCLDIILEKGEDGIEEAKEVYRKHVHEMLTGEANFTDYTISKSMKHNYAKTARCDQHPTRIFRKARCEFSHTQQQIKDKECKIDCKVNNCKECKELKICGKNVENCDSCKVSIPHVVLADKIRKRSPGDAPASGDRVPYVYVDISNMTAKQFERVEDPRYAKENNMKLDLWYYWNHQIEKPMNRLFQLLVDNPKDICFDMINQHVQGLLDGDYDQKMTPDAKKYLKTDDLEKKKKHDRQRQAAERKRKKLEAAVVDGQQTIEDAFVKKPTKKRKMTAKQSETLKKVNSQIDDGLVANRMIV